MLVYKIKQHLKQQTGLVVSISPAIFW